MGMFVSPELPNNYFLEVAKGNIPNHTISSIFGENPDVDTATAPEDVWNYGGIYTFSTVADIDTISSSNAGDTQELLIKGLDTNWAYIEQTKTLNGQNKVVLNTSLIRVLRIENNGSTDIAGDAYCYADCAIVAGVPSVTANIRAVINNSQNISSMAIYTVPAGKTAYYIKGFIALTKNKTVAGDFSLLVRTFGGVFKSKRIIGLTTVGSSSWQYQYPTPIRISEKSDIVFRIDSVTANDAGAVGGADFVLVDN